MSAHRLLLVHGAFHGEWCWDRLTPELERLGIKYDTVDLPFTSPDDDVLAVRRAIDRFDQSLVVLGHSFGGAVISAAASETGMPYGAATSLIFLTAFMVAPNQAVDFSGAPGLTGIELGDETASISPAAATLAFYHRCLPEDAAWATAHLRAMPTAVLMAPTPPSPAWKVMPSTYIVCSDDQILSVPAQQQMAANADQTRRIDSDHSPFLSCPQELAEILHDIVSNV